MNKLILGLLLVATMFLVGCSKPAEIVVAPVEAIQQHNDMPADSGKKIVNFNFSDRRKE